MKVLATRFVILSEHTHRVICGKNPYSEKVEQLTFKTGKEANEHASTFLSSWSVLKQEQVDDTLAYSHFWRTVSIF